MDKSFSGKEASAKNGYAGYDKTVYLFAKAGQKMEIFFDPKVVPDAILFSYSGKEVKLSPFMGAFGGKYVKGEYSKEREEAWNKDANMGKAAPAKRESNGGKSYLVIDYKDYLNNVINKGGGKELSLCVYLLASWNTIVFIRLARLLDWCEARSSAQ